MTDSLSTRPDTIDPGCPVAVAPAASVRDVVFLLLNDVVLMDFAGPVDAFRGANAVSPGSYRVRFIAAAHSVRVAGGPILSGCEPLPAELAPGTIIVIPGVAGDGRPVDPREPSTRRAIAWLRVAARAAHTLCVSSGAVLAA